MVTFKKIMLGIGIVFVPYIFAWFTLRKDKGHTTLTRILSFGWLTFLVLMVVTSNRSEETNKKSDTAVQSYDAAKKSFVEPKRAPESERRPEPTGPTLYNIGDRFQLGNFAYQVTNVKAVDKIGSNRYTRKKPQKGAHFVVIEYNIENMGNKTDQVLSDDFKIIDSQNRIFTGSSAANTALAMSSKKKDLFLTELQPGLKRDMITGFEVLTGSIESGIILKIPEKGFLSSGAVFVELQRN